MRWKATDGRGGEGSGMANKAVGDGDLRLDGALDSSTPTGRR